MEPMYYIGLDVHKRKISYCVKDSSGRIHSEGWIPATRFDLDCWMKNLPQPWSVAGVAQLVELSTRCHHIKGGEIQQKNR
jgi:hypothetical protein